MQATVMKVVSSSKTGDFPFSFATRDMASSLIRNALNTNMEKLRALTKITTAAAASRQEADPAPS